VVYVWVIGMIISFLFELARYKNLEKADKAEYKKYFMLLNAFIIFLYASSYTGLTKQIGAWGELQETVNKKENDGIEDIEIQKKSGVLLEAVEWAIPIFAKQTSYFPDVTVLAENIELRSQNVQLIDSLRQNLPSTPISNKDSLNITNANLKKQITQLINDKNNCAESLKTYININSKNKGSDDLLNQKIAELLEENQRLLADKNSLQNQLSGFDKNYAILSSRVKESNGLISRLLEIRGLNCIQRGENSAFKMLNELCSNNRKETEEYKSIVFNLKPVDNNWVK
jgi:hypothetical protein